MTATATPVPTPLTQPYWDACARGELLLPQCETCAHVFFPPASWCPACQSNAVGWLTASGRATLYSYTLHHRAAPGFEDRLPYTVAVVDLAEGPRMMTNIVGVEQTPEALELDMPLEVDFEPRGDVFLPVFRPAAAAS